LTRVHNSSATLIFHTPIKLHFTESHPILSYLIPSHPALLFRNDESRKIQYHGEGREGEGRGLGGSGAGVQLISQVGSGILVEHQIRMITSPASPLLSLSPPLLPPPLIPQICSISCQLALILLTSSNLSLISSHKKAESMSVRGQPSLFPNHLSSPSSILLALLYQSFPPSSLPLALLPHILCEGAVMTMWITTIAAEQ
jgi:hypothetical protein